MANPQPTPFVRFSKELFEAFYQNPPDNLASSRLWLWVIRWTWADFGKDETPFKTLGQIGDEVQMSKPQVCKELAALVRCRRLKIGANGGYAIQKDYDLWRADPKKRTRHFGNQPQQMTLEMVVDNPVDKSVDNSKIVSNGETGAFHRGTTKRFTVAQFTVSPYETPIRSKNTVKNVEKDPQPNFLMNGKKDTPRNRAELGHEDYAPEDHPVFKTLSFKIQNDLADAWKISHDKALKQNGCKRGCGRPKAAEGWPYCRSCTACSCGKSADGTTKFIMKGQKIFCIACSEEIKVRPPNEPIKKG